MPTYTYADIHHLYPAGATRKDGIITTLAAEVAPGAGPITLTLADGSYFPAGGSGEPASCAVLDQDNPALLKDLLTGWTKSGHMLTGCTRQLAASRLAVGDLVVIGFTTAYHDVLLAVLTSIEARKAEVLSGTANPATGAGVAAAIGAVYVQTTTHIAYIKINTDDTDWQAL